MALRLRSTAPAALLALLAAGSSPARAQRPITGELTLETFDDFAGTGFSPSPAADQLDSDDWRVVGLSDGDAVFGDTRVTGDFARGLDDDGAVTGGIYAFDTDATAAVNPGLGLQLTDADASPGAITLRLVNQTGAPLSGITLLYSLMVLNDQDRSSGVTFEVSTDDASYTAIEELAASTPATADGVPVWAVAAEPTGSAAVSVPVDGLLYLRWTFPDLAGAGARDELALDDLLLEVDLCGDGIVDGFETCDDAGFLAGDGCSATCALEPGWDCAGTPTLCTDIDECLGGADDCSDDANCSNQDGGFTCTCVDGFAGDGVTCADIDECATATDDCSADADCANDLGTYSCSCHDGFDGDGVTCTDIDECAEGLALCDPHAECSNMPGGFTCTCADGFGGDGLVCIENCGNGLVDDGEGCDDGNGFSDDGCEVCAVEDGWLCDGALGAPSLCARDGDGDGLTDDEDNCPTAPNQGQADSDDDGLGDACDPDAGSDDDGGCGCRTSDRGGLAGAVLLGLALLATARPRRRRRATAPRL